MRRIILLFAIVLCAHTLYSQTVSEIVASLDGKLALMHDEESRRNLYISKKIDITSDYYRDNGINKYLELRYEDGSNELKYVTINEDQLSDCGGTHKWNRYFFDENRKLFLVLLNDGVYYMFEYGEKKNQQYKIYYSEGKPVYCTITSFDIESTGDQEDDEKLIQEAQVTEEADVSTIPEETIREDMTLIQKLVFDNK